MTLGAELEFSVIALFSLVRRKKLTFTDFLKLLVSLIFFVRYHVEKMVNAFSGPLMYGKCYQSFPNFCTYKQKAFNLYDFYDKAMLLNTLRLNVMMHFFRQRKVRATKHKEVYKPQSV